MILSSETFKHALSDPIKEVYVKIDLLDINENLIEEITTSVIDGSVGVSKEREIRRTFSLSLLNDDNNFTWSIGGKIWLDKRVKLWVGLNINGTIEYIPQGVFVLTEMSALSSYTGERTVTLAGSDKWQLLNGDPIGKFTNVTTIEAGANIKDAIKIIAQDAGIDKFLFDDCSVTVPYSLSYNSGDSRGKAIKELADLAVYSCYFDVNGYMRFRPQVDAEYTTPVWTYDKSEYTLYAKSEKILDHHELFNKVLVIGGSSQSATVSAIAQDNSSESTTGIPVIGERLFVYNNGSPDPLITSTQLAQARADYELKNHLRIAEKQPIELLPNYLHEEEDIVRLVDEWTDTDDKYELINFNVPLRAGQMMSGECWRVRKLN